jgi:hypothetical protein
VTAFQFDPDSTPQMQVAVNLEKDWMKDGVCAAGGPVVQELFFSYDTPKKEKAVELCSVCPVRSLCYAYAIVYNEAGTWGGSTDNERLERRPHIFEEVVELWPRLYKRWQGKDVNLDEAFDKYREPLAVGAAGREEPTDRARARARAREGFDSPYHIRDSKRRARFALPGEDGDATV